jgi:AcrR family transcriptional regulator
MNIRSNQSVRRMRHMAADKAGLITAATAVFAERGYHGASIRDIARHAGFSVGGVYQFFPSKDALYLAVLDEGWQRLKADVGAAMSAGGSLAQLAALTRVLVENYEGHRGLWQVLAGEQAAFPAAFKQRLLKRLTSHIRHMRGLIAGIIRRGVEERVFRPAEVELMTSAYGGIIRQSFDDAMMLATPVPSPDAILAVFLNGAARPGSR